MEIPLTVTLIIRSYILPTELRLNLALLNFLKAPHASFSTLPGNSWTSHGNLPPFPLSVQLCLVGSYQPSPSDFKLSLSSSLLFSFLAFSIFGFYLVWFWLPYLMCLSNANLDVPLGQEMYQPINPHMNTT
jgi:hypothetical protein